MRAYLTKYGVKVTTLSTAGCDKIQDSAFDSIHLMCPNIQVIDVSGSYALTNAFLTSIYSCVRLTSLTLSTIEYGLKKKILVEKPRYFASTVTLIHM
jgi:hypothetical protein